MGTTPRLRDPCLGTFSQAPSSVRRAGLLLGVGLVRALGAILLGRHIAPPSPDDMRLAEYYVGSFALAGAGLGTAKPLLRTPMGTYVGFALAGATIGSAIIMAFSRSDPHPPPLVGSIAVGAAIGAVLGCAFARGWLRGPS